MALGSVVSLRKMVQKMRWERAAHERAVRNIDAIFEKLGISEPGQIVAKIAVKPSGGGKKSKRTKLSGSQFVLQIVKEAGAAGIPSGELASCWNKSGRARGLYTITGTLQKRGLVKKQAVPGKKGGIYIAV